MYKTYTPKTPSHVFSCVPETWKNYPTTTNAVERRNRECKTDRPLEAMMNVYKMDKNACRSKDEESREESAESRRGQCTVVLSADRTAQHGPPDHCSNFRSEAGSRKQK